MEKRKQRDRRLQFFKNKIEKRKQRAGRLIIFEYKTEKRKQRALIFPSSKKKTKTWNHPTVGTFSYNRLKPLSLNTFWIGV